MITFLIDSEPDLNQTQILTLNLTPDLKLAHTLILTLKNAKEKGRGYFAANFYLIFY